MWDELVDVRSKHAPDGRVILLGNVAEFEQHLADVGSQLLCRVGWVECVELIACAARDAHYSAAKLVGLIGRRPLLKQRRGHEEMVGAIVLADV